MKIFIVALVLTVYVMCLNAQEIHVDENFEGLESFKAKETIPKYSVEKKHLPDFLEKIAAKLVCPNGKSCPGYQTCCRAGNIYRCCPHEFVRLVYFKFRFFNFFIF